MDTRTREAFAHLYSTYFGEHQIERQEIENLPSLLVGCDAFIDVGASLGMFTYFANQTMERATIIAIEADSDRYEELARNCEKWQGEGTNTITAIHAAASDERGSIRFYRTGTQISGGFFPVNERSDEYEAIEVQQMLLDDLYEPGRSTLVKIDVEGAELRVVRGAQQHIDSGTTRFLIETHWWGDRDRGYTTLDLLRYLRDAGMQIEKTVKVHTSNYHVRPGERGRSVLPGYLRVAPLLIAKTVYGRYVPRAVRNAREQRLNRRRRRQHGHAARGDQ